MQDGSGQGEQGHREGHPRMDRKRSGSHKDKRTHQSRYEEEPRQVTGSFSFGNLLEGQVDDIGDLLFFSLDIVTICPDRIEARRMPEDEFEILFGEFRFQK